MWGTLYKKWASSAEPKRGIIKRVVQGQLASAGYLFKTQLQGLGNLSFLRNTL